MTRRGSARRSRRAPVGPLITIVAALTLAGCAGADTVGSPSQRLASWSSGTQVGQSIGILQHDVAAVEAALASGRADAVRTACGELQVDAASPIDRLPSPDPVVTGDLNHAYQDELQAANACYQGAGTDAALAAQARSESSRGMVLLQAARDRITQVTGAELPTTTTTAPPGANGGDPFGGE